MKPVIAAAVASLICVGLGACGGEPTTSTSSPSAEVPLTLEQACPQVGGIVNPPSPPNPPTSEYLNQVAADLAALTAKTGSDAQALIEPIITALRGLAATPADQMKTSPSFKAFIAAEMKLFDACQAAGAPLPPQPPPSPSVSSS